MALVVQKYGGSSVQSAERIKRVAERIVRTRKDGNDVVVVASAMGDTTDELTDLAIQVHPSPPPREMDMLLTSGERISNALLAMAINALGGRARSFTGSQAGMITTGKHGDARIVDVTPGRIHAALADDGIALVAGFQGVSADSQGDHDPRPRRLGHHRRRDGRGHEGRHLRDLHRRRRRLLRRPAHRPRRAAARDHHLRGDARDGRVRGEGAAPARGGVRAPRERPPAGALVVQRQARHDDRRVHRGAQRGTGSAHRRRARPVRGQGDRRRRPRPAGVRGAHLPRRGRRRRQPRHGAAERRRT